MIDFRQDTNGDIDLTGGDIHYVESTVAHQRDLLLTAMGELKHAPTTGVGIHDFINDETPEAMLRMVRRKFIQDGMTVNSVKQNAAGQIEADAYYDVYPVVPHFAEPDNSIIPEVMTPLLYNITPAWRHGDTVKAIGFRLVENGEAVDITGATINIRFRLAGQSAILLLLTNGSGVTLTDPADGKFVIDAMICPLTGGSYQFEVEVIFANQVIETWVEGSVFVTDDF
ncbi:MAG: hypothetical protein JXQ80_12970 [Bacteroidales bacterium]|nr:hypothetical protein [Bacteroidales bacterium]